MKHLFLLRHAKSDWDDRALDDFDRPLSRRGQAAVSLLTAYFRKEAIRPDSIVCSPARRTRETLAPLLDLFADVPVLFEKRLYEAGTTTLAGLVADLPERADSVLIIGHNPGLQRLALLLAEAAPRSPSHERMAAKFPTGALAELTAGPGGWRDLGAGQWRLTGFTRPVDLGGTDD